MSASMLVPGLHALHDHDIRFEDLLLPEFDARKELREVRAGA